MSDLPLPQFSSIDTTHFVSQLDTLLQQNLTHIDNILSKNKLFTWQNLMHPLESMEDSIERFWSPFTHLHAVVNTPALRDCYQACLPKLTAYHTAIGQNRTLYDAIKSLDRDALNATQCKIIEDTLRDFHLSGVDLPLAQKQRFEAISTRLSELANQFENHVLDAVSAFQLHITEAHRLQGLPEHILINAQDLAKEQGLSGWVFNLEYPCFSAIVTYADDRKLRETLYQAYVTRASDQGPSAGQFDNSLIMNEILALRHEQAHLLGFTNYAELSLATKMAESTQQVLTFLQDLRTRSYQQGRTEFQALQQFAAEHCQISDLQPWDTAYVAEKKQLVLYNISQEELRLFFPLNRVMQGLFDIIKRLYGMTLEPVALFDSWHVDVLCYRVLDEHQNMRGIVYLDLFARPQKRGGAWMDSLQSRFQQTNTEVQFPIATLTCNFTKPAGDQPPMLSHDELLTLFHEFGHCLQHLLTTVPYLSASGIHGVEWDAVELPSQFFENWCWDAEALRLLSAHVVTGEALAGALFEQLNAAKNFQSAMTMLRQLEFALFDFRIHLEYTTPSPTFIADILADVRRQTALMSPVAYNRFQHAFTHIFGGGYAAGYYSYKWAEVLSSDAFSRFEEEGVFNPQTGRDFLHDILEVGGSCKASQAFLRFRGRPATIDALLRHSGILEEKQHAKK